MNEAQVLILLREKIKECGGQRAFAKRHAFSAAYVNDVINGRRGLAENICATLGVTRIVVYQTTYHKVEPRSKRVRS